MEVFTSTLKTGTETALDPAILRGGFPLLASRPGLAYLDNASTTQKPREVIDALVSYYTESNANVHRAVYGLAEASTRAYEGSRGVLAAFIGAGASREIVFTRGTTEALNLLAFSLTETFLREGDEVLLTGMEHHANLVPWQLAAERRKLKLRFIPFTPAGELDLDRLPVLVGPRTRIVSLPHTSNVLGTVNPVREIADFARGRGALVVVDAAQAVGHRTVDVGALGCDFLVFSGHKMYGPLGIGVLWGRAELLEKMEPYQAGGDMISSVEPEKSTWNDIPWKFEAGTPNIEGAVGLAAAAGFIENTGLSAIERHERDLTSYALGLLDGVPGLKLFGRAADRAAVFAFTLEGVHSHDAAQFLDRENIAIRSGHHCAQPLHRSLGAGSTARASLAPYNTREEIDRLVLALGKAGRFFS